MVKIAAVLDSTCLIGLERIGRLDLLTALLDPVLAPPAVIAEFGSQPGWLTAVTPANRGTVAALNLTVDAGEAEAIALAYEQRRRIILDDRKARAVAARLGVPVTGTVGLLLKAKRSGVVSALRPLLDALDAHQFHVSRALRVEERSTLRGNKQAFMVISRRDEAANARSLRQSVAGLPSDRF